MRFHCPRCKGTDLRVTVTALVSLLQHDEENIETIDDDATCDHEWSDESLMLCVTCGHESDAMTFDSHDPRSTLYES